VYAELSIGNRWPIKIIDFTIIADTLFKVSFNRKLDTTIAEDELNYSISAGISVNSAVLSSSKGRGVMDRQV